MTIVANPAWLEPFLLIAFWVGVLCILCAAAMVVLAIWLEVRAAATRRRLSKARYLWMLK